MKQERRSFLRRVAGVLLAPLGAVAGVGISTVVVKPCVVSWSREAIYTGYIVDEHGDRWATWEPSREVTFYQLGLKPPSLVGEVVCYGDGAYKVKSVECLGEATDAVGTRCIGYKVRATYLRRV